MLFDIAALSGLDTYKLMGAIIVPRPIAWITTVDEAGLVNAAPFSFFNALSGDPPVVGVGIGARAPGDRKDTGHNIAATGQFVVNLVSGALAHAMNVTAAEYDRGVDELREAGLTPAPSTKVRPPRIAESPAALECEVMQIVPIGPGAPSGSTAPEGAAAGKPADGAPADGAPTDKIIVLGRVLALHVRDDAVLDEARRYIDTPVMDLIGRMHGGGWYARTTDRFDMPRLKPGQRPPAGD